MKHIFLSVLATAAIIFFAASLFLNSILGVFGLVSMSSAQFTALKTSKSIIEKIKVRHKKKRLDTTNRLVKRSGQRVLSISASAITLGAPAVAVAMATFEIQDYCEEHRALEEEHNALHGITSDFDFDECFKRGEEDFKKIISDVKESIRQKFNNTVDSIQGYAGE